MKNTIEELLEDVDSRFKRFQHSSYEEYETISFVCDVVYPLADIVKILVEQNDALLNSVETLKTELSDVRKDIRWLGKQI